MWSGWSPATSQRKRSSRCEKRCKKTVPPRFASQKRSSRFCEKGSRPGAAPHVRFQRTFRRCGPQSVFPRYTPPEKRFDFLSPPAGGETLRGLLQNCTAPFRRERGGKHFARCGRRPGEEAAPQSLGPPPASTAAPETSLLSLREAGLMALSYHRKGPLAIGNFRLPWMVRAGGLSRSSRRRSPAASRPGSRWGSPPGPAGSGRCRSWCRRR